jgi:hypothetical protein
MHESEASQQSTKTLAIRTQETPVHRRLGFHTAFGTEWFEFSPARMKEYFYETTTAISNQSFLNDISFSTVLEMSIFNINEAEDQPAFGSNLPAILDCKAKEESRLYILRQVCGAMFNKPEHELLRHQVTELMEADLTVANITWTQRDTLYTKVRQDKILYMLFSYMGTHCSMSIIKGFILTTSKSSHLPWPNTWQDLALPDKLDSMQRNFALNFTNSPDAKRAILGLRNFTSPIRSASRALYPL